jgi:N-acylneuraminate cytidylyltransferase
VVVADAYPAAKAHADMVLTRAGGRGAVRELADLILANGTGAEPCPTS